MFRWRTGLDVTNKTFVCSFEGSREVWRKKTMRIIIADALSRAAEQGQIIRLARMRDREGVDEQRAITCQAVDKWCAPSIYDLPERVVLEHDHYDMIRLRQRLIASACGLDLD